MYIISGKIVVKLVLLIFEFSLPALLKKGQRQQKQSEVACLALQKD